MTGWRCALGASALFALFSALSAGGAVEGGSPCIRLALPVVALAICAAFLVHVLFEAAGNRSWTAPAGDANAKRLPGRAEAIWLFFGLIAVVVFAFGSLYATDQLVGSNAVHTTQESALGGSGEEAGTDARAHVHDVTVARFWDCCYFSAVTFMTVGYGDFAPMPGAGQVAVCCEMAMTLLLLMAGLGILVGRLANGEQA